MGKHWTCGFGFGYTHRHQNPLRRRISPFNPEQRVYERLTGLGGHNGILAYHGDVEGGGTRLEYASNHDLQSFVRDQDSLDAALRMRWLIQLAETPFYSRGRHYSR